MIKQLLIYLSLLFFSFQVFLIRFFSMFIPTKLHRKSVKENLIKIIHSKQDIIIAKINRSYFNHTIERIRLNKQRIRVGFMVIFDGVFPGEAIFERMLKNNNFSAKIYIIPDTFRGENHMYEQLKIAYTKLKQRYSDDVVILCVRDNDYLDISNQVDFICSANPYDFMTYKYYQSSYLASKGILSFHISYGYHLCKNDENVFSLNFFNNQWKYYIESDAAYEAYKQISSTKGKNAIVVGYPKMDNLAKENTNNKINSKSKTIIIAPHHTILPVGILQTSTFLKYSAFFLSLPRRYPNINWIFRPHPLLFHKLRQEEIWGEKKTTEYLEKICSYRNIIYENGGDYFESFNSADGIILDSVSFIAEWLYTEKKGCFLLKTTNEINDQFYPCGQKMISLYVNAREEEDIVNYIDDVLTGRNILEDEDIQYIRNIIKINYPYSSDVVIRDIEKACIALHEK